MQIFLYIWNIFVALLVIRGEMKALVFSNNRAFFICMIVLHAMDIFYSHKNIVSD